MLEGRLRVQVDGQAYDPEPGAVATLPAGSACTFAVHGEEVARFLAVTTGDRAGRFFADFAGNVSPDRPVAESMPEISAVTGRHGITFSPAGTGQVGTPDGGPGGASGRG